MKQQILSSSSAYVRCVSCNAKKLPRQFNTTAVKEQLQHQATPVWLNFQKICCSVHVSYDVFFDIFKELKPEATTGQMLLELLMSDNVILSGDAKAGDRCAHLTRNAAAKLCNLIDGDDVPRTSVDPELL